MEDFIEQDIKRIPQKAYKPCTGRRKLKRKKAKDKREESEKLDERLNGRHFNAYWQICKKLGCPRTKKLLQQGDWQDNIQESEEVVEA